MHVIVGEDDVEDFRCQRDDDVVIISWRVGLGTHMQVALNEDRIREMLKFLDIGDEIHRILYAPKQ